MLMHHTEVLVAVRGGNLMSLFKTFSIICAGAGHNVRPSLVPMRDLVPTSDGGRIDSVAGRTGAQH